MAELIGTFQDRVTVSVGNIGWAGWTQAEVTRHIDAAAGSFQVELAGPGMELPEDILPFLSVATEDAPCTVTCNGQLVLTGRIDTTVDQGDADTHRITVSGRSLGRNAVDSSHIDSTGTAQYNNRKPSQIAKRVTDELGIPIQIDVSDERAIEWFRYNLGEPALNVIRSAALKQGINVGHRPDGSIWLADQFTESAPAAIVMGENILKWTVRKSAAQRNSDYKAKGQKLPNANTRGKKANQQKATAQDGGLQSYRPRYVIGLGDVDSQELEKRVQHEAARRKGLALNVTVTVVGWTANGGLWSPGQLAFCSLPRKGVNETLLIKTVKHVQDYDPVGTITEMTLVRPEAYQRGKASGGKGAPDGGGLRGGAVTSGRT